MEHWFVIALYSFIGILIVLPPKYDPAIRIKERQMKRTKKDKSNTTTEYNTTKD